MGAHRLINIQMKQTINGRDLLAIGYKEGKTLGLALQLAAALSAQPKEELLGLLKKIKDYPENFLDDKMANALATAFIEEANSPPDLTISLIQNPAEYAVYGSQYIEEGARSQMDIAM